MQPNHLIRSLLLLSCLLGPCAALADSLTLANANVVNIHSGEVELRDVVVRDGVILSLSAPGSETTADTPRVDLQQRYLIPGLWDMHVHFEGRDLVEDNALLLPVYLAYGITGVREAASNLADTVLAWRGEIARGERLGPHLFTAGQKFEGIDSLWDGDREVGSLEEMRRGMDDQQAKAVDFIKITANTLEPELFLATATEAQQRGFLVSGHVPLSLGIFELVEAGLSSIEHASHMLRLGHPREEDIARAVRAGSITPESAQAAYRSEFDQAVALAAYSKLAESGVALTPTLIGGRQLAWLDEIDHSNDLFLQYLTEDFTANYQWRIQRMADETRAQSQQRKLTYQLIAAQIPLLHDAGVLLLAGSDSAALNTYVYPAEALHTELGLFTDAGLTPLQALRAATINGAQFMGRADRYGSVEVGKAADLVVLESNPLEDIRAVGRINALVYGGQYFDRRRLNQLLENAARRKRVLEEARAGD